jgi:hypothetical protein
MTQTVFRPWEHFTNDEFFRALRSEAYLQRFWCRGHPIYPQNGGWEFHNPEKLQEELDELKRRLPTLRPGRNRWVCENMIRVRESWLEQTNWILDRLMRGML